MIYLNFFENVYKYIDEFAVFTVFLHKPTIRQKYLFKGRGSSLFGHSSPMILVRMLLKSTEGLSVNMLSEKEEKETEFGPFRNIFKTIFLTNKRKSMISKCKCQLLLKNARFDACFHDGSGPSVFTSKICFKFWLFV